MAQPDKVILTQSTKESLSQLFAIIDTTINRIGMKGPYVIAIERLREIEWICERLMSIPYVPLPVETLETLKVNLDHLFNLLNSFGPENRDVNGTISSFDNQYSNFKKTSLDILTFDLLRKADAVNEIQGVIGRMEKAEKVIQERVNGLVQGITSNLNEVQFKLNNYNTLADKLGSEAAVSKYKTLFQKEQAEFDKSARTWLITTFVFISALILFMCVLIWTKSETESQSAFGIVQYSINKVLIVSAIIFAITLSVRNYRASKHNSILNRHRKVALDTFEAIKNSGTDAHTRDSVLLAATNTIFGVQNTGYNTSDGNDAVTAIPTKLFTITKALKDE